MVFQDLSGNCERFGGCYWWRQTLNQIKDKHWYYKNKFPFSKWKGKDQKLFFLNEDQFKRDYIKILEKKRYAWQLSEENIGKLNRMVFIGMFLIRVLLESIFHSFLNRYFLYDFSRK